VALNIRKAIIGVVAFIAVVGVVAYLSTASPSSAIIIRLVTTNPPVEGGIIIPANEKRHFDPGDGPHNSDPQPVIIKVGVPVELVFVNNDDIETHQLVIPAFNVSTQPIQPFETDSVTFISDKVGTFKYFDLRPVETYTYTDYRGEEVHQVVDHSDEFGRLIVEP
jgi:hypothetical protein